MTRWTNAAARRTALVLFVWRLAGFAVFEISAAVGMPMRAASLFAPNVFEHLYLFWTVMLRMRPRFALGPVGLAIVVLAVGLPKIGQEWVMHYQYPDQTWNFIRDHAFAWLY